MPGVNQRGCVRSGSLWPVLKPGELAPLFELPGLAAGGGILHWSLQEQLKKGPALLVFVKQSCPTCQYALPLIDRIYRNYPNSRAAVVTIAQEDAVTAARMVQNLDIQMPVLLDLEPFQVSEQYAFAVVPAVFYITPEGKIDHAVESFAREELKEINQKIARTNGLPPATLFRTDEGIPPFRPG